MERSRGVVSVEPGPSYSVHIAVPWTSLVVGASTLVAGASALVVGASTPSFTWTSRMPRIELHAASPNTSPKTDRIAPGYSIHALGTSGQLVDLCGVVSDALECERTCLVGRSGDIGIAPLIPTVQPTPSTSLVGGPSLMATGGNRPRLMSGRLGDVKGHVPIRLCHRVGDERLCQHAATDRARRTSGVV